jgi:hypothetical protein
MSSPLANGYVSFNTTDLPPDAPRNNTTYLPFNLFCRNIAGWAVDRVSFLNRTPNINRHNNVIAINDGTTTYEATVAEGFYDGGALATALAAALNAQLPPLGTWAVVHTDNKFDIDNGGTTPFNFVQVSIAQTGESLASVCGWKVGNINDPLSTNFSGYGDLRYSKYVDIVSQDLNQFNPKDDYATNNATTNILTRVFINDWQGGVEAVQENTNLKMLKTSKYFDTGSIKIECRDEFGNLYYDPENVLEYTLLMITV